MKKIVLGTQNKNKLIEVKQIYEPFGFEIISTAEAGIGDLDVEEDGQTFEENAIKKATEMSKACGLPVLADDSGLAVDYLNGAPGVHSARFAGEQADHQKNNQKLLDELKGVKQNDRTARFVCVLAYVDVKKGIQHTERGEVEGLILDTLSGEGGFGYDPLFYFPPIGKTFGQAPAAVKNKYSHRGRALIKMQTYLEAL